ncbi:MAG: patatin family protein [Erysipelotrichaceae bacterium]|nr:patatin family protein [Erysipelotrichaceae bacterium]
MSKTGLVLEGGGLRGVFTAGVIDCFLDKEIDFDYCIGVSAGSCNTFSYVGKQRGYVRSCMIQKDPANAFWGVRQMVESHKFVDLDKIFYEYTEQYGFDFDEFIKNKMPWEMVVSNMATGKAEYMHTDDIERSRLIGKASCSMPGLTSPVEIDGQLYLDGGICDSIPVQRALDQGCEKLVIVLTRKKGNYSRVNEAAMTIFRRIYGDYPNFLDALAARTQLYHDQVDLSEKLEEEGKAIIIRPTFKEVSRLESKEDELLMAYYHGYTKTKEYSDKIIEFLKKQDE